MVRRKRKEDNLAVPVARTGLQSGVAYIFIEFMDAFSIASFTSRQAAALMAVLTLGLSGVQNFVERLVGWGLLKGRIPKSN